MGLLNDETLVSIPLRTYDSLIRNSEKIDILERTYQENDYLNVSDIKSIFGFEDRKKEEKKEPLAFEKLLGDSDIGDSDDRAD